MTSEHGSFPQSRALKLRYLAGGCVHLLHPWEVKYACWRASLHCSKGVALSRSVQSESLRLILCEVGHGPIDIRDHAESFV